MSVVTPPDYQFVLYDSVSNSPLGTLPLTNVKWSHGLGGLGSITADLPVTSPKATLSNIQTIAREIAVWRNGVPVMMGPIIAAVPSLANQVINITCASPWWWLTKRANELPATFAIGTDVGTAIWTLINTAQGLAPNGTAHITQSPSYPVSTFNYASAYVLTGVENDPVSKLIEDQSLLYPGFDFEMSYAANTGNMQVTRYFNIFSPFKTATADRPLTEADLTDFTMPENGSDVITRSRDFSTITDEAGNSGTLVSSVNDLRMSNNMANLNPPTGWAHFGTKTDGVFSGGQSGGNYQRTTSMTGDVDGRYTVVTLPVMSPYITLTATMWVRPQSTSSMSLAAVRGDTFANITSVSPVVSCPAGSWTQLTATWTSVDITQTSSVAAKVISGMTLGNNVSYVDASDCVVTSVPILPMVTGMFTRDAPNQATLDTWSKGDLFLHKWPMRTYTATYTPSPAVPFGAYNTGDLVPLNVAFPYFSIQSLQRLVAYTVSWSGGEGVDETVELIFNDPVKTAP